MSLHCMIDLETFGVAKDSCIIQIAAVQFNHDFYVCNTFNEVISPESCQALGMSFDMDTIMWWMNQSEEAKQKVVLQKQRSPLTEALKRFKLWLPKDTCVWSKGASFDLSILDTAYRLAGLGRPWKHTHERCFRTMNSLVPEDHPDRPKFMGTKHDALDDCRNQINQLEFICKKLNIII